MQVGFAAIFTLGILYGTVRGLFLIGSWGWYWLAISLLGGGIVTPLTYRRAKERTARRKADEFSEDERPPVLYLRSFDEDDSIVMQFIGIGDLATALLNHPMASGFSARNEEQLASALEYIGPMVALGRPGERRPIPGAMRIYSPDDKWEGVVDGWLARARLVILRIGTTGGLWWETVRVIETVRADKILFYMLGTRRTLYDSVSERMRVELGVDLPCFTKVQRWGRVSGFFTVEIDKKPRFLPLSAPFLRTNINSPLKGFFYYTLRPVYDSLGVDWAPLPVSGVMILLVLMPFVLLVLFALLLYMWVAGVR